MFWKAPHIVYGRGMRCKLWVQSLPCLLPVFAIFTLYDISSYIIAYYFEFPLYIQKLDQTYSKLFHYSYWSHDYGDPFC